MQDTDDCQCVSLVNGEDFHGRFQEKDDINGGDDGDDFPSGDVSTAHLLPTAAQKRPWGGRRGRAVLMEDIT